MYFISDLDKTLIYSKKEKPTNSEFIALLAERIPFLINAK